MNVNKKVELIFEWLPTGFLMVLLVIQVIDKLTPSISILSSENLRDVLLFMGATIVFTTLQKINKTLRHFKNDGLPVPAAYLESARIKKLISSVGSGDELTLYVGFLSEEIYSELDSKKICPEGKVKVIFGLNTIKFLRDNYSSEKFSSHGGFLLSVLPVDSIIAVHYSKNKPSKISMLRNYENGIGMYALELLPHKNYLNEMCKSLDKRFKDVTIRNQSMLHFFHEHSIEKGLFESFSDDECKLDIMHRGELFDRSKSLLEKSRVSLKAIDLTPVESWIEDQTFCEYLEANSNAIATLKTRIKVFDKDDVKNKQELFKKYINRMEGAGVKLLFLDVINYERRNLEDRGIVIIDGEVVITYIKPERGTTYGKIDFSKKSIAAADKLFTSLKPTINSAEFIKKFLV